jgi:hypothetical protein
MQTAAKCESPETMKCIQNAGCGGDYVTIAPTNAALAKIIQRCHCCKCVPKFSTFRSPTNTLRQHQFVPALLHLIPEKMELGLDEQNDNVESSMDEYWMM